MGQGRGIIGPLNTWKGGDRVLKEGERAPNFTTVDHTGREVRLADLRGKKVWLWFYSSPGGSN